MLTRLDQLLRLALNASGFVFFYLGGALMSWLWLPWVRRGGKDPAQRSARCRASISSAYMLFHDYMRICRLIRYDPRQLVPQMPQGPCVLVANHPTLVDVTALMAAHPPITCVVKRSLLASLLIGPILRYSWHISGGSGPLSAAADVLDGALVRLAAGLPVLIFPEGTRSPEGGLHPFMRGAFEIACRADVPVVPLFITCTPPVLAKEAPWYRTPPVPSTMDVRVLPALSPSDWGGDSRAMAADVRAGYLCLLAGDEPGTWQGQAPPP